MKVLARLGRLARYTVAYAAMTHCTFEYIGDFVLVRRVRKRACALTTDMTYPPFPVQGTLHGAHSVLGQCAAHRAPVEALAHLSSRRHRHCRLPHQCRSVHLQAHCGRARRPGAHPEAASHRD